MKFISAFIATIIAIIGSDATAVTNKHLPFFYKHVTPQNNCINFSISVGTGCQWMCNYCANTLGTNNYYFTTGVCTYQDSGCVGNPQTGVTYTCCSN